MDFRGKRKSRRRRSLDYGHGDAYVAKVLTGVNQFGALLSVVIVDVVLAGDNAIVRHRESVEAHSDEKAWSVEFGVLQIWQKQDSQWRLLARQGWKT